MNHLKSNMERRRSFVLELLVVAALLTKVRGCDQGWRDHDGKCYFFSTEAKTWLQANSDCLHRRSNLMSIQDFNERLWVSTQLNGQIYWIGLNDQTVEGVYEWSDGTPYIPYLSFWMKGQPDNYGDGPGEDCGQVVGSSFGQWNDENCNVSRKFICKHANPNPVPKCDLANGWMQHDSNCYKLTSDTRKSWSAARADCVMDGGDLVSITSQSENQYVVGLMGSSHLDLWIGLSTLKCNKISCKVEPGSTDMTWSDAQPVSFTHWAQGQPQIDTRVGSCAAVIRDTAPSLGNWSAHHCRYERPYMCKRPLHTLCLPGWHAFAGSCYWIVSNDNLLTTWHEALTKCSAQGAHLLIIDSEEEQFYINSFLPDFHHVDIPDIWIGLSDKDKDGTFLWVDKSKVTFSNYGAGWPKNTENFWDCGQIFTGNYAGKWETTNCFKKLGYICEMTGGQNPKPTTAPDSHCDGGYLLYSGSCYHFETEDAMSWDDAEARCAKEQGHLASFHAEDELAFLIAHMPGDAWVGLNDKKTEGQFVFTDGSPADFLPWGNRQPDNWENEDCVHVTGTNQPDPGKLYDDFCTSRKDYICKKSTGAGPPPQPPTSGPGWSVKCGPWMSDPYNDFCYLFNLYSMRTWAEARADCLNQGGDLLSVTEPFEQAFVHGVIQQSATGVSLWMGGHDSITEGGWEWTDGSPFRYIHWNAGNPDDHNGEDCLSILINSGYWNDDHCQKNRGYVCKRRGNVPVPPPPHDGFLTALVCQDSTAVLHCPHDAVINVQAVFYGRKSKDVCPHLEGADGDCEVEGLLPTYRKLCDNRPFCFALAHVEDDPCPSVSKYLKVTYSCEQKVCLHGLGVEDGNITDVQLSASSSSGLFTPDKARLNGDSCWMPSGSQTSSWIQVDLGQTRKVTGVVVQGCPHSDSWVTKFKLQHSADGRSWKDYTADGKLLPGSTDRNTPDTQLLGTPPSAGFIRILPAESNNMAGLRFDVLGCSPEYAVTCEDQPNFSSASDEVTVHCPAGCATAAYAVYGTTTYRGDSNICAAAIHAGVILDELGGDCTLLKTEGRNFYPGSVRNGITSKQFSGDFSVSYTFADGELRCPGDDWYQFGEFCYKPSADRKSWHQAQQACRTQGAELVSILSMAEQNWLESYLYAAAGDVWTGLSDLAFPGMFVWSDRHLTTFTYWAPGEPDSHEGFHEDCVEMRHQSGRWDDVSCSELNAFICKRPRAHYPLPSARPTASGCPPGWGAYGYACYWMEEAARSWTEAKAFCTQKEAVLLHVGDIYEQAHFTVALSTKKGFWWMGLRARGGAGGGVDYIWDNGLPVTFTHWDREQPDNGDGTCVAMTTGPAGGFWDDKQCSEEFAFICEKQRPDVTPPTAAPTPPPAQGCSDGWTSLPQFRNCYKLFHNVDWSHKKSWAAARDDCFYRGGHLVSVHGQEEEDFLSTYSRGSSKWIGLKHNALEGGYSWSDGTPLSHTNWGYGEPNNHGGREECVEMVSTTNGTFSWWNDLNCDAHQDWICKITKGKTPIPPPEPPSPLPAPECGSNPGWRKNNGICYYYNDTDVVDFHTARWRCYQEKALLVSILSSHEQAFVNSMVGTGRVSAAWIGMRKFGVASGQYMWLDNSPVSYTHWSPGEPNDANGEEQCVQMNRHQGGWNDANCGRTEAGYVCKKYHGSDHTPPPPTQPWEGNCPEGWRRFKDKCFLFKGKEHDIDGTWFFARDWCRAQGGDLAVIDSRDENDFVTSYLKDLRRSTWIGLWDVHGENQYAWSDGFSPVLYTNWNDGEPNNAGGAERCVTVAHNVLASGEWNDDACMKNHSFVCSRRKSSGIKPPPPTKSPCPPDYVSWYQNCYKLVTEAASWEAALGACRGQQRGNLLSVDTSYEQAFVSGVVLQGKHEAWMGLRRQDDGAYKWSDGWPVFFTQWGPGEPSNTKDEGCVSMHAAFPFHGTWNDTNCNEAKSYICKISFDDPPPTPAPGDGKCQNLFVPYGRHCYFVYDGEKSFSWPEAEHHCQEARGELASFHSRAEVEFIRNLNHTKKHHLWIGLTRDRNFGWGWTDKTAVSYVNWAAGEPNMAFHPGEIAENCVEMYHDGHWNDNNCLERRSFVCRHRQYYVTDENKDPVHPTDDPRGSNGGPIAGAIIGAVLLVCLVGGLVFYAVRVRGYKLSGLSFLTRKTAADESAFNNPNFGKWDT